MKIRSIAGLRGPNIWANFPVLEARVELGSFEEYPSNRLPGFNDRLTAWLPSLIEHRCSIGERGGFLKRLRDGTWLGHILEHVTLELQSLAGRAAGFGRARETGEYGVYKVVVSFEEEELARACMATAHQLLMAAIEDTPFDLAAEIARLRALGDQICLGPSTASVVAAARKRGVPHYRLNAGNLVQLGQGSRARRFWATETDRTSAIASGIAQDKELTRQLLHGVGIPVPLGTVVETAEAAWAAAEAFGTAVVVKPRDGNHGRGVSLDLQTREQVLEAFAYARKEGSEILVETYIPGVPHRILVVNGRMVAASRGGSESVTGDGVHTVRELVDIANCDPLRRADELTPLTPLVLDDIALAQMARQQKTPDSVPAPRETVILHHNGDYTIDETDLVHPEVAARVGLAVRMVGLDVAGVDVVAEDIGRPLEEQGGAVIEVNASPGLLMHLQPIHGQARPVGEAILEGLFPSGSTGRIPVVAVAGSQHRTAVVDGLLRLLAAGPGRLGVATRAQLSAGTRSIDPGELIEPERVLNLLTNPLVDHVLTEVTATGVLDHGLGFDQAAVAVVTDYLPTAGEPRELEEDEETRFKAIRAVLDVVPLGGLAVVNADSPRAEAMTTHCAGEVLYFSESLENAQVMASLERGGRALAFDGAALVLAQGRERTRLPAPGSGDGTMGEPQVVLPVLAVQWARGLDSAALLAAWSELLSGRGGISGPARVLGTTFRQLD